MATHAAGENSIRGPMRGREKKPKKELEHLRIEKAENGGHIVSHHFAGFEHEPESHVFAKDEGPEMMDHVAKHMGVEADMEPDEDDDGE